MTGTTAQRPRAGVQTSLTGLAVEVGAAALTVACAQPLFGLAPYPASPAPGALVILLIIGVLGCVIAVLRRVQGLRAAHAAGTLAGLGAVLTVASLFLQEPPARAEPDAMKPISCNDGQCLAAVGEGAGLLNARDWIRP